MVRDDAFGPISIRSVEGEQDRLLAGRIHFKHYAQSRGAAIVGGAVEIASPIEDHTRVRVGALGRCGEGVQQGFTGGLRQARRDPEGGHG